MPDDLLGAGRGPKVQIEGVKQGSRLAEKPSQEVLFIRADYLDFINLGTLQRKAGVPVSDLRKLVCKELVDNGLDACDRSGSFGIVLVRLDHGALHITDAGGGLRDATPETIAELFRVSRPMESTKHLRKMTRGALGNGIRVVMGWLTATGGALSVHTGEVQVTLKPELDGTSTIISSSKIEPCVGMALTLLTREEPFTEADLAWARDAIELAKEAGPAFTRKPSLHWLDADTFCGLLATAAAEPLVRTFLEEFDGCSRSIVRTKIAAQFHRRTIRSLSRTEAAELLRIGRGTAPYRTGQYDSAEGEGAWSAWSRGHRRRWIRLRRR